MKVTDYIHSAQKTLISFEVLPPQKGRGIESLYQHLDPLMEFRPSFINVTYHRSEYIFRKRPDGSFQKVEVRKRPGTVGICAAIMNRYKVDAVPHLICGGFSREETENALIDLNFLGIDNVLVLRGDAPKNETFFSPEPDGHSHAVELIEQVVRMNQGCYLEEELSNGLKTQFCIGVAGYPEKHFEAPNPEVDLEYLKQKVDRGADYITTQMFFDNAKFFSFQQRCRDLGIQVPILPGLKPIVSKKQLTVLPHLFHIDIPAELSRAILACKNDEQVAQVGTEWLIAQSRELKAAGVPVLHYYTMGKTEAILKVVAAIA